MRLLGVLDRISTFVERETTGTEGDTLIEFHVLSDDTRFSNHHTRAVVDGEVFANLRTWVDVDSRFGMSHFREHTWNERHTEQKQFVCHAVVGQCLDDRIATDDFAMVLGCWVAVVGSNHVGGENLTKFRQGVDKPLRDAVCLFACILAFVTFVFQTDLDLSNGNIALGLVVEVVLTMLFVLVVLGATAKTNGATNNFAGLAIGLSLILIHLVGIHYTGTSVNPARSFGPALFEGGAALSQVWVFIVGPLVGGGLAALIWKMIEPSEEA